MQAVVMRDYWTLIFAERFHLELDDRRPAAARSRAPAQNFWPSVSAHFMKSTIVLACALSFGFS